MSEISIRQSFKDICSDKYDKTNMFIYLVIIFISTAASSFCDEKTALTNLLILLFIGIITYVFAYGINVTAIRNYTKFDNNIFPNLFKDFRLVSITGLKTMLGIIILSIITFGILFIISLVVICGFLAIKGQSSNPSALSLILYVSIIAMLIILICLAFFVLYSALFIQFINDLKISSFINFKAAFYIIKKHTESFFQYIGKSILLGFLFSTLYMLVSLPFITFFGIYSLSAQSSQSYPPTIAFGILISIVATLIFGIYGILITSLTGQCLKSIFKN